MQSMGSPFARRQPFSRFVSQPFRKETGDGGIVITRDGAIYKLEGVLGVGGLSIVYLATRYNDRVHVALKLPNNTAIQEADADELLRREAELLMRFKHPGIIQVLDCGQTTNGEPFLATELIRAQTVDLLLVANGGRLPLARAAEICLQMADALQHVHECGVVHRDIKPGNVLIRSTEGRDLITLFDFGIAAEYGEGAELVEGGSLLYASPEQLENKSCVPASDVYQLGLLLYEMVVGDLPFEKSLMGAVQYKHGALPLLPENRELGSRALAASVREFLTRCLSPIVTDRPCSMRNFAYELRQAVLKTRMAKLRYKASVEASQNSARNTQTISALSASQAV